MAAVWDPFVLRPRGSPEFRLDRSDRITAEIRSLPGDHPAHLTILNGQRGSACDGYADLSCSRKSAPVWT